MAQNITLLGASYSDVPSVLLPKTGGGTAQFDDTTDANASASDIASGKTAYVNGAKIVGTASGAPIEKGTFSITSNTRTVTINHSLGVVPKLVYFCHQDLDTAPTATVRVSALGAYIGANVYVTSSAYKSNGVYDDIVYEDTSKKLAKFNITSASYGFTTWNSTQVKCVSGSSGNNWRQGTYDYIVVG